MRSRTRALRRAAIAAFALLSVALTSVGLPAVLSTPAASAATTRVPVQNLRMISYMPSENPWIEMWRDYDRTQIDTDLATIKSLGANSVRIVLYPDYFGFPTPRPAAVDKFLDVMGLARDHGLAVQLTLFDWHVPYSQINDSLTWMRAMLAPVKNDPTISLVEIRNEMDVYAPNATVWANAMLRELPSLLPGVPRTVSVAGAQNITQMRKLVADIPASNLDVINIHLYGTPDVVEGKLLNAIAVRGSRPVFVGEMGRTTINTGKTAACSAKYQAQFYYQTRVLLATHNITGVNAWFLRDINPEASSDSNYSRGQLNFGLQNLSGSWKPAASVVRSMYTPARSASATLAAVAASSNAFGDYDGGFECGASTLPSTSTFSGYDAWGIYDSKYAPRHGTVRGNGTNKSRTVYLGGTTKDPSGKTPSIAQRFRLGAVKYVSAGVNAKLVKATGTTRVGIAWFKGNTYAGTTLGKVANNKSTVWQRLYVLGTAPTGATNFQVHLLSDQNSGTAYFDSAGVAPTKK